MLLTQEKRYTLSQLACLEMDLVLIILFMAYSRITVDMYTHSTLPSVCLLAQKQQVLFFVSCQH